MSFSSLFLESFTLCSFRNAAFVFPAGLFDFGLLWVSSGYLGKNGCPLSISVFRFRLFSSFSLSASDLGNHGQIRCESLSGRFHGRTPFFLLGYFSTGSKVVVVNNLFLWKISSLFSNWFCLVSFAAARLSSGVDFGIHRLCIRRDDAVPLQVLQILYVVEEIPRILEVDWV